MQILPSAVAEARVRVSIFYLWTGMFVIAFLGGLMPIVVLRKKVCFLKGVVMETLSIELTEKQWTTLLLTNKK